LYIESSVVATDVAHIIRHDERTWRFFLDIMVQGRV